MSEPHNSHTNKKKAAFCPHASAGVIPNVFYTASFLIDTGAQPTWVTERSLPTSWTNEARKKHTLRLCFAIDDPPITY